MSHMASHVNSLRRPALDTLARQRAFFGFCQTPPPTTLACDAYLVLAEPHRAVTLQGCGYGPYTSAIGPAQSLEPLLKLLSGNQYWSDCVAAQPDYAYLMGRIAMMSRIREVPRERPLLFGLRACRGGLKPFAGGASVDHSA
jgi:hypothetical protein